MTRKLQRSKTQHAEYRIVHADGSITEYTRLVDAKNERGDGEYIETPNREGTWCRVFC